MGKLSSYIVITSCEKPSKRKRLQSRDRRWTTVVQGVGATGRAMLAFIVFAGKVLLTSWTDELPRD
jgi:hypothetical protein